jgi:hypothetical protein
MERYRVNMENVAPFPSHYPERIQPRVFWFVAGYCVYALSTCDSFPWHQIDAIRTTREYLSDIMQGVELTFFSENFD